MNICIFGDSITKGHNDDKAGGWVNRLKASLSNDEIYNLGISGDTTEDVLKRFDVDIRGKKPDMIVFAIGVNDAAYFPEEKRNWVGFDTFKKNLTALIKKSRQFTDSIVFIGLTPVDEGLTKPIPWRTELYFMNEDIIKYDEAIGRACEKEKLQFIDILADFSEENFKEMLSDGLHPNAAGHAWMAKKIAAALEV